MAVSMTSERPAQAKPTGSDHGSRARRVARVGARQQQNETRRQPCSAHSEPHDRDVLVASRVGVQVPHLPRRACSTGREGTIGIIAIRHGSDRQGREDAADDRPGSAQAQGRPTRDLAGVVPNRGASTAATAVGFVGTAALGGGPGGGLGGAAGSVNRTVCVFPGSISTVVTCGRKSARRASNTCLPGLSSRVTGDTPAALRSTQISARIGSVSSATWPAQTARIRPSFARAATRSGQGCEAQAAK